MILVIDAGNSRIKWGRHTGDAWLEKGWIATRDVGRLSETWAKLEIPVKVVASNVAGAKVRGEIERACQGWPVAVEWVGAVESQCGVSNNYQRPEQLGPDRWAALIAAWNMVHGGCVVVNAGTAVTVDALSDAGVFLGGAIVPGLQAMRRALADSTTAIAVAEGQYHAFPDNTADAVYTGALMALAGAVEQMRAALARELGGEAACILSGGDADLLLPLLSGKTMKVDNLVMEGLVRIAKT